MDREDLAISELVDRAPSFLFSHPFLAIAYFLTTLCCVHQYHYYVHEQEFRFPVDSEHAFLVVPL